MTYEQEWANWKSGPPAADPRGPQHGAPDPEFATLCGDAERGGAHVELDVSAKAYGGADKEYRNLVALHVRHPDRDRPRVTVRWELGDTLRSMAERARRELEAKL